MYVCIYIYIYIYMYYVCVNERGSENVGSCTAPREGSLGRPRRESQIYIVICYVCVYIYIYI